MKTKKVLKKLNDLGTNLEWLGGELSMVAENVLFNNLITPMDETNIIANMLSVEQALAEYRALVVQLVQGTNDA